MRTREEHLQWCKDQAMEYWRAGALMSAVVSMASHLQEHPETKAHDLLALLGGMRAANHDREAVKQWIEGFR
jgi:hypothetical protein